MVLIGGGQRMRVREGEMTHEIIVHADPLFLIFFGGGTGERERGRVWSWD